MSIFYVVRKYGERLFSRFNEYNDYSHFDIQNQGSKTENSHTENQTKESTMINNKNKNNYFVLVNDENEFDSSVQ